MKRWVLNLLAVTTFFFIIQIGDAGYGKAKEYIVHEYVEERPDYKKIVASEEYRNRSITPMQEKLVIDASREIGKRLFDLKLVVWLFNASLIIVFSIALNLTNRGVK